MNGDTNRNSCRRSILKTVAATGFSIGTIGVGSAKDQPESDEEEIYIALSGGSNIYNRIEEAGYEIIHRLAGGSVAIIQGPAGREDELESIPVVNGAVSNRSFTVDTAELEPAENEENASLYEDQWAMEQIRAFDAHDSTTGEGTTIAVIDTGIDHTHPDLKPQLDIDRSRLFRNGTIYSGTEQINVITEPKPVKRFVGTDVEGHGSLVAGIAAASRNETGIVGLAPDATLVSLRPFFFENPQDYRLYSTVVDLLVAIDYAVKINVDVVNISLTVTGRDPGSVTRRRIFAALNRIIEYAIEQGTSIVAAMGNQGINTDEDPGYILPASNPGTISVAAVDETGTRRDDSNYGDSITTVAAPGDNILSTVPEELFLQQYAYGAQTSTAAPHVSGLACLLRELNPELHPRRITQTIKMGAVGNGTAGLGAGRIGVLDTINRLI